MAKEINFKMCLLPPHMAINVLELVLVCVLWFNFSRDLSIVIPAGFQTGGNNCQFGIEFSEILFGNSLGKISHMNYRRHWPSLFVKRSVSVFHRLNQLQSKTQSGVSFFTNGLRHVPVRYEQWFETPKYNYV